MSTRARHLAPEAASAAEIGKPLLATSPERVAVEQLGRGGDRHPEPKMGAPVDTRPVLTIGDFYFRLVRGVDGLIGGRQLDWGSSESSAFSGRHWSLEFQRFRARAVPSYAAAATVSR